MFIPPLRARLTDTLALPAWPALLPFPLPRSLKAFYYLAQDLKCLVFSLISLHFKIKPLGG